MTASGRRSFLTKVATAGVAMAAGVAIVPTPPEADSTIRSSQDGAEPTVDLDNLWGEAPITDEDQTPIARYQYGPAGDSYDPTSPINVVFPLTDYPERLPAVMAVLADAGWTTGLEEYTRYAWDREAQRYVRQMATAAETYYGANGRLHVRCWEFEGVVSMQVHEDSAVRPKHVVTSYARGRRAIESLFRAAGWTVSRAAIDLTNGKSPDHDGYASVVVPRSDGSEGSN